MVDISMVHAFLSKRTDEDIDVATCVSHCVETVKAGQKIFAGIFEDDLPEGPIPTKEDIENADTNK